MYVRVENADKEKFHQGDIIDNFPFLIFSPKLNLLNRIDNGNLFELIETNLLPESSKKFFMGFQLSLQRVVVITQTCDIQNNNTVMIAPIYSIKEVTENGLLSPSNVGLVSKRRGVMKDWFYLPNFEDVIEESFIDFQKIHYLPKEILNNFLSKRVVCLSDWGTHLLDWAISDFFSRPIEDKYRR